MPRSTTRKAQPVPDSGQEAAVVRTSKAIPAMDHRPVVIMEAPPQVNPSLPCTGRCGHCDCHPCQLHAPI